MRSLSPAILNFFSAFRSPGSSLILLAALASVLLPGCTRETRVVEESWPDGKPRRECIYKGSGDDRELIRETIFYANGQAEITGTYRNGKRDGRWVYYFENGNVWSEGLFREGKNEGKRLTYFENGKLRYEAWYKDDQRTGIWKFYDEAGNLIKEVDYR